MTICKLVELVTCWCRINIQLPDSAVTGCLYTVYGTLCIHYDEYIDTRSRSVVLELSFCAVVGVAIGTRIEIIRWKKRYWSVVAGFIWFIATKVRLSMNADADILAANWNWFIELEMSLS